MVSIGTFIVSLLAFIVAIGVLVVFHEFGHFWVARKLGVKVLRFSVGFGKPLWRYYDSQKTEYVIAALPLGGYVKMLDEREQNLSEAQKQFAFNRKPVWARFSIVLAGPLFNFIFAIFAYWLMFMIGISSWVPKIGEVKEHSIAQQAGLVAGEEIIKVDGIATTTWQQVVKQLLERMGDKGSLTIETKKNQSTHHYTLDLQRWQMNSHNLLSSLGIKPHQPPTEPVIYQVLAEGPAAKAGIQPKDKIIKVNQRAITDWQEFIDVVVKSINQPVSVGLLRGDQTLNTTVVPQPKEMEEGEVVGFVGVVVKTGKMPNALTRKEQLDPFTALVKAVVKTQEYIILSFKVIGKMISGAIGLHTLGGPLTIAQGAGATVIVGFQYYLGFLAMISISLGVLNLLPIPILDGGHLLYYVIEMLTGKPVSERVQLWGFKLGCALLIGLMVIAFYNDLRQLW